VRHKNTAEHAKKHGKYPKKSFSTGRAEKSSKAYTLGQVIAASRSLLLAACYGFVFVRTAFLRACRYV
jgi:hypothetical protein